MNKKTGLAFALCLVLVLVITVSCSKKRDSGTVTIGVILPLTGDAAVYGKALKNGTDMAVEEHNASKSLQFRLVYEDDAYSPKQSVSAVRKLIDIDKPPAIIGGAGSTTAEPITQICLDNKVILLSPFATAPSLSNAGPYFFRIAPSDNYDGAIMADVAYSRLGLRNISILYINAPYGKGITDVFTNNFEKLGGKILDSEGYSQGATDFRTQLTKISSSNPEAIFLPSYIKEITNILKQSQELGIKTRFLGVNSMYSPTLIEVAGDAAEGAVFSYPTYDAKSEDPVIKSFVDKYRAKYGTDPDIFAASGYDCLRILAEAIRLGDGTTGPEIQRGMHMIKDFAGPSGTVTFDQNGDVQKPLRLMQVKGGQFISFGE